MRPNCCERNTFQINRIYDKCHVTGRYIVNIEDNRWENENLWGPYSCMWLTILLFWDADVNPYSKCSFTIALNLPFSREECAVEWSAVEWKDNSIWNSEIGETSIPFIFILTIYLLCSHICCSAMLYYTYMNKRIFYEEIWTWRRIQFFLNTRFLIISFTSFGSPQSSVRKLRKSL